MIWQLQDAKARFSELLIAALQKGPQVVTRRGVETAVLVPIQEWYRLPRAAKPSLKDLLLAPDARTESLVPDRRRLRRLRPGDRVTQYLLDTNVVSELRKPKPHGAVVAWVDAQHEDQLFLSAVTIGEVQAGIERVRSNDSNKAVELERWLDQVATSYNILSMDASCFLEWGRVMHPKPDELLEDATIAATARVHSLTVVQRNEGDFAHLGVRTFNPFTTRG